MQALQTCLRRLSVGARNQLLSVCEQCNGSRLAIVAPSVQKLTFHSSQALDKKNSLEFPEPKHWLTYNDKVFPPQGPNEDKRPAYVCHMKPNIKYSPKNMWYIACFVRGMSVDEAIKQLNFVNKKGAVAVKETILEAQQLAINDHNVEFKSNLWVAESFVGKGYVMKGARRHARGRFGIVKYKHCHYFVRLEEGPPPKHYYYKDLEDRSGPGLLGTWLEKMRRRRIVHSL